MLWDRVCDPVAAAIGKAVSDATGVRITELPLTPESVLGKLKQGLGAKPLNRDG